MFRKKVYILLLLSIISFSIIGILSYRQGAPPLIRGGFYRHFNPLAVTKINEQNFPLELADPCGMAASHYYFSAIDGRYIFETDRDLRITHQFYFPLDSSFLVRSLMLSWVDSPNVVFLAGNAKKEYTSNLLDRVIKEKRISNQTFYMGVPITADTYILKGYDTTGGADQVFSKSHPAKGTTVYENGISERLHDGGISLDGCLSYDSSAKLLIYTYYFFNRMDCIDTNLNLVYRKHTIDTTMRPTVKAAQSISPSGEKLYTPDGPPKYINFLSAVSRGRIYVNSLVMSEGERPEDFKNNSILDIYDLKSGTYLQSIYVPTYQGKKMNRFKIYSNLLVALYGRTVIVYRINA